MIAKPLRFIIDQMFDDLLEISIKARLRLTVKSNVIRLFLTTKVDSRSIGNCGFKIMTTHKQVFWIGVIYRAFQRSVRFYRLVIKLVQYSSHIIDVR